ncbi:MAG TPA: DNA polymerase III subunit delta, partial [Afipia sp.]|nr:DNA polymerase III subunit delta [Afipia sp.]
LLGGDRQASRNEIRKVALYAHGQREVTLDDVVAIVTDASGLALDPIVDNAFAGRAADVETAFAKAMAAGTYPGLIIMSAQRHAALLHKARLSIEEGRGELEALDSGFPRLHFSRKTLVETALRNTTSERMARVMAQLADAAFDMRKQSSLAEVIAQRALLAIAVNTRRRG